MPRPQSISFDRVAHLYDETRRLPSKQMEAIVHAFRDELESYGRILEVGVGTGRFAIPLDRVGVHVIGVDISSQMVERGLGKGLQNVLLADAQHLPFAEKSVDATYSIHVLHLVGDWRRALREIARVTRHAYYTIATYWEEGHTPYEVYWSSLRKGGIERSIPGVHERKLPDILPPMRRIRIGAFEERHKTAEWIGRLENKIFSGQWKLPEDAHADAIEATREEFDEEAFTFRKRVDLIRWDVKDLPPE